MRVVDERKRRQMRGISGRLIFIFNQLDYLEPQSLCQTLYAADYSFNSSGPQELLFELNTDGSEGCTHSSHVDEGFGEITMIRFHGSS